MNAPTGHVTQSYLKGSFVSKARNPKWSQSLPRALGGHHSESHENSASLRLNSASAKLMDTYNEFKVCAGLYGLADRFHTVFSSIKGSIPVGQISSIEWLIRDLAKGERTVIDRLRNLTQALADEARALEKLQGARFESRKKILYKCVELERKELRARITWLAKTTKHVLSKLNA